MTIPTSTTALRSVEALEHFANAYGVALPTDVSEARQAALQIAREARMRPSFDMQAAARAAVGADVSKSVKALAKDAQADAAEREAMSALVTATAERAASVAQAATYSVVEAAMSGPTLRKAADDLAAILAEGDMPIVVGEDDPDGAIIHARARKAEKVAEEFAARAAALPGFGGHIEMPVLLLLDPAQALENHPHGAVRAAARGIAGQTDMGAWQKRPMSAAAEFRPIAPTAPASLLLMRKGAAVTTASSLNDLDKRHDLVAESAPIRVEDNGQGWL
ncbi:MAG: hypothetical protein M3306_17700 [Actinomycetota bacterium]|nr:hypothetical protein [Actinomycetota bacterium]